MGGNTSCVEVRASADDGGETLIILDAGTGLRAARRVADARRRVGRAHLFLSHLHWDHIQGFPFFAPAYVPGNRIGCYAPERCAPDGDVRAALDAQMRAPHFPVGLDAMRAELGFCAVAGRRASSRSAGATRAGGGGQASRTAASPIASSAGGRSVVYATDTEHDAAGRIDRQLARAGARRRRAHLRRAVHRATEYAGQARLGPLDGGGGRAPGRGGRRRRSWCSITTTRRTTTGRSRASRRRRARASPTTVAAREGLELDARRRRRRAQRRLSGAPWPSFCYHQLADPERISEDPMSQKPNVLLAVGPLLQREVDLDELLEQLVDQDRRRRWRPIAAPCTSSIPRRASSSPRRRTCPSSSRSGSRSGRASPAPSPPPGRRSTCRRPRATGASSARSIARPAIARAACWRRRCAIATATSSAWCRCSTRGAAASAPPTRST